MARGERQDARAMEWEVVDVGEGGPEGKKVTVRVAEGLGVRDPSDPSDPGFGDSSSS